MTSVTARAAEIQHITQAVANARQRQGVLLLTGEQGVGKTSLLQRLRAGDPHHTLYLDASRVQTRDALTRLLSHELAPHRATRYMEDLPHEPDPSSLAQRLRQRKAFVMLDHLEGALLPDALALLDINHDAFTGALCVLVQLPEVVPEGVTCETLGSLDAPSALELLCAELSPSRHDTLQAQAGTRQALDELIALCMGRPLWIVLMSRRLELMSPQALLEAMACGSAWSAQDVEHDALIRGMLSTLSESTRRVLVRCAVFEGLFSVLMCEEMYGTEELLDELEELRGQGVLEVVDAHDEVMCRIHPMFRGYLLGTNLEHEALLAESRDAHAHYFARCATSCVEVARGAFDHQALASLEPYQQDVEVAARHFKGEEEARALEQVQVLMALRRGAWQLAFELSATWSLDISSDVRREGWNALIWLDVLGSSDEPMRGLELARAWLSQERGEAHTEAMALGMIVRAAEIASNLERAASVTQWIERGLKLSMGPAQRVERGRLLLVSALTNIHARDWFTAQAMCQEAAHLFEVAGHVRLGGKAAYHLGHIYKNLWKGEESVVAYERALVHARATHDVHTMAQVYRELAWMWLDRGEMTRAMQQVTQMEELAARHQMSWLRGVLCMVRGQVWMQEDELAQALVEFEAARWHLASSQQHYLLAATLYFEFLCYWACGEIERARVYMQLGEGMSDQISSAMALTCYDCARIIIALEDGELDGAQALLDAARRRHEELRSTSWLGSLLDVHEFYVLLRQYMALPKKSTRQARAMAVSLGEHGVALQARHDKGGLVTDFNAEVRMCWRQISAHIPPAIVKAIELGMIDPSGEALIVNRAQQTFRAPHCSTWVDMSRREVPFRLLCVLVDQRLESPGQPVDASELCERVWLGESITQESAQNRLYVTIATLRKEGLRAYVTNTNKGYVLDPEMRLIEV